MNPCAATIGRHALRAATNAPLYRLAPCACHRARDRARWHAVQRVPHGINNRHDKQRRRVILRAPVWYGSRDWSCAQPAAGRSIAARVLDLLRVSGSVSEVEGDVTVCVAFVDELVASPAVDLSCVDERLPHRSQASVGSVVEFALACAARGVVVDGSASFSAAFSAVAWPVGWLAAGAATTIGVDLLGDSWHSTPLWEVAPCHGGRRFASCSRPAVEPDPRDRHWQHVIAAGVLGGALTRRCCDGRLWRGGRAAWSRRRVRPPRSSRR